MKRLLSACLLTATLALPLACGSEADESPDPGGSNVGDKIVSDLTTQEAQSLCSDNQAKFDQALVAYCTVEGLTESAAAETPCEMERDACLANNPTTADCSTLDPSIIQECPLTVSELESCLNEVLQWLTSLSCESTQLPAGPACAQQLEQNCTFEERQ